VPLPKQRERGEWGQARKGKKGKHSRLPGVKEALVPPTRSPPHRHSSLEQYNGGRWEGRNDTGRGKGKRGAQSESKKCRRSMKQKKQRKKRDGIHVLRLTSARPRELGWGESRPA
jgi:hypothetical protein